LSVTRKEPREGAHVIQLLDLSRTEPDPARFQVPADFAVPELRLRESGKLILLSGFGKSK